MPSSISPEQVREAVADALGGAPQRVERLPGSVANQDFLVEQAPHVRVVLKAGPSEEIAAEAWACERLRALGVPVPRVLTVELDPARLGMSFLILQFVQGEPSDDTQVAREAGASFRRVHEVELSGWGALVVGTDPAGSPRAAGCHRSWREAVEADLAGLSELVDVGLLDPRLADAALVSVSAPGLRDYDGPGVLLHNDLKPAHLFGIDDRGARRLSAVIDWGDASVGDPAAEIARLSMSGPAVTAAFLDGYGVQLTDELADRLARYRILWNIRALSYEHRAGGDWFDTYRDRIRQDVQLLS